MGSRRWPCKFNQAPCPSVWTRPTCGRRTLVDWLPRPTTVVLPLTMLCKLLASTRIPSLMGKNTHTGLSGTPGRTHGANKATFGWSMAKITVASRRRPRLCSWPDLVHASFFSLRHFFFVLVLIILFCFAVSQYQSYDRIH